MAPSPLTPSSLAWKAIFKGANYDASNDQQSSSDHDLVGNEKNAVLEGQTSGSGDATMLYFRARMGDEAPRTSVMLGIDINQDGRFDLFVEANVRDSDPTKYYISLHKSDPSKSGVSPSTTGWLNSSNNTLIERPLVSSKTYLSVASAGGDIDANGKTDAWISFGFSFSDLKAFVKDALGIDTFSLSTPVALSVFTSGGQTANGDVAGVSGISTRSWESLGILTTNTLTGFASGTPATPTIDPFSTSDTKPTINGSWGGTNGGTDTLSVTVNKETYTTSTTPALVISGTNWSLTLPTTAEGTYDITATATRSGGTTSSTTLSSGMTVVAAGDVTAPTLVSVLPTDDSKAVEVGSNFVMTFSENVAPGPGSITLYQGSNIVEVFSLHTGLGSFGGTAVISGNTITINPGVLLSTSTAYNMQVDADAVTDTSGNLFAGLATDTAWNFTTDASLGAPTTPTVTALMTNTAAPTIGGTWGGINGGTDSLSVAVGGTTYTTSNGLSVSGTTWSLAVPTLAEGTYSVTVTASRSGGSTSKDATSNELVIDTTAPTIATFTASGTGITSGSGAVHAGDVVTITLTGSEILSVTGTPTLTLGNGATATYTGGSGTTALTFTYTVGAGDTTTADLTVTAVSAGIKDRAGNALSTSNLGSVGNPTGTLEVTPVPSAGNPLAPTITALLTNSTTPTVSGTWGGTNSGTDALSVTVGGTTYTTANGLSVSGTTWSLALPALTEGTYSVTVTASRTGGGTTSDATTNELVVDTTAPTIATFTASGTGITSGSGTIHYGDIVTITLTGSEILTVSGTPTLTLGNGATATYTGGSGTTALTFTYTVGAGDATTADLTVTAVSGGITDRAGNALSTSNLGSVGNPAGTLEVASLGNPSVPAITALVTNSATPTVSGTWGGTNSGTDALSVTVAGTTYTTANGLSVSGTTWSLALPALTEGTYSVTVTASRTGGGTSSDTTTGELVVDTTAPTIAALAMTGSTITSGGGTLQVGDSVTITLNGSEILTVSGTPTLTLGNGATATYTGGSGTNDLTFTYTVGAGDATTADLTVTAVSAGITDRAGNALSTSNLGIVGNPAGTLSVTTAICYLRGTLILTDRGEVPVETLAIGDTVVTRWGGLRPIKWIGRQSFGGNVVDWRGAPVRITAGALGGGLPRRDLWISPGHSMLVNETLVMGHSLVNGVTIVQDDSLAQVDYFQIELETHDCVLAEGAWSETYADCRGLRRNFHNAAEFHALYPGHIAPETVALCAPRPEAGPALDAALRPLVARAAAEVASGPLNAWIDRVSDTGRVSGWAVDTANPDLPVLLEVVLGDEVLGTVLAANYRHDLFVARIGRGRCGYIFEANRRLTPHEQLSVSVRRHGDGAAAILPAEARVRILDEAAAPLARAA